MIEQIKHPMPKVYISSEKAKKINCVEWSKIQKEYMINRQKNTQL